MNIGLHNITGIQPMKCVLFLNLLKINPLPSTLNSSWDCIKMIATCNSVIESECIRRKEVRLSPLNNIMPVESTIACYLSG